VHIKAKSNKKFHIKATKNFKFQIKAKNFKFHIKATKNFKTHRVAKKLTKFHIFYATYDQTNNHSKFKICLCKNSFAIISQKIDQISNLTKVIFPICNKSQKKLFAFQNF